MGRDKIGDAPKGSKVTKCGFDGRKGEGGNLGFGCAFPQKTARKTIGGRENEMEIGRRDLASKLEKGLQRELPIFPHSSDITKLHFAIGAESSLGYGKMIKGEEKCPRILGAIKVCWNPVE